jgi:hypothetical protein
VYAQSGNSREVKSFIFCLGWISFGCFGKRSEDAHLFGMFASVFERVDTVTVGAMDQTIFETIDYLCLAIFDDFKNSALLECPSRKHGIRDVELKVLFLSIDDALFEFGTRCAFVTREKARSHLYC